MSKKSLVALAHGLDVQENVTRVFDMMGGAAKMIEPNSTVVLKPNTLRFRHNRWYDTFLSRI